MAQFSWQKKDTYLQCSGYTKVAVRTYPHLAFLYREISGCWHNCNWYATHLLQYLIYIVRACHGFITADTEVCRHHCVLFPVCSDSEYFATPEVCHDITHFVLEHLREVTYFMYSCVKWRRKMIINYWVMSTACRLFGSLLPCLHMHGCSTIDRVQQPWQPHVEWWWYCLRWAHDNEQRWRY